MVFKDVLRLEHCIKVICCALGALILAVVQGQATNFFTVEPSSVIRSWKLPNARSTTKHQTYNLSLLKCWKSKKFINHCEIMSCEVQQDRKLGVYVYCSTSKAILPKHEPTQKIGHCNSHKEVEFLCEFRKKSQNQTKVWKLCLQFIFLFYFLPLVI